MQTSIEERLAKTSIATWICTFITMLIQLISVPICLRFWGTNLYGEWLAVFAAFTLMRTIDYGYTMYIGNEINILYHINNSKLRLSLASAVWGILFLGVVQILILIILYLCHNMGLIMGGHNNDYYNYEIFLSLLIMSICWICSASYIGIVHRILNPLGMLYQSTWMMMWLQVAEFFVIILAALFKMSILSTAVLFSIANIFFYIFSAVYVKSLLPQYFPWWRNGQIHIGLINVLKSIPLTLGWGVTQGGSSALVILISAFLTPASVPIFTTLRTISNSWVTLTNSFTTPMLPEAVRFHSSGQWQKLIFMNNVHWVLISIILNLSILIIFPFIGSIFKIWTANHLFFNQPLLSLLLAAIVISSMSAFMSTFLSGINTSGYIILSSVLRGGISLLLSWILLPIYGILSLGIALFLAEICVLILTNFWFFHQIMDKLGGRLLFTIWPWISSTCVVLFLLSQCLHAEYNHYIYCITLFIVTSCGLLAWNNLEPEIKLRLKSLILNRIRRNG